MREPSPFESSPIAQRRKKIDRRTETPAEYPTSISVESKPIFESPEQRLIRVERANQRAEEIADKLTAVDISEQESETISSAPIPQTRMQKIGDRIRNFFGVPKSIKSEVARSERSGETKDVDTYNADEKRMPKIIRKPSKIPNALLIGTALGAIGATHEPQIERAAHHGIEYAKHVELKSEIAFGKFVTSVEEFIARNKPFGKEAFAHEGSQKNKNGAGEGDGTGDEEIQHTKAQQDKLNRFAKGSGLKITEVNRERALNLIEQIEYGWVNNKDFFLTMELIHGQITQEQFDEVNQKLWDLESRLTESLSETDRKSPIRVAFELAKQRTTYVREKADMYSIAMNGEGNCEALVRFLLAEVPRVMGTNPVSMAVQVYTDHVRFLVRNDDNQPWEWIDGHSHGVLTKEEMEGTLIISPKEMMEQSLGLKDRVQKNETGDPIPEKSLGYKTNSMLRWETRDARKPGRASSPDGNIPERADETADAKKDFASAIKAPKREHIEYIQVSPEFFPGSIEIQIPQPEKKGEIQAVRIAPKESALAYYLQTGSLSGGFNDLSPLKGINIRELTLQNPSYYKEGAAMDIDLSPLTDSDLTSIKIDNSVEVRGFEKLDVSRVENVHSSSILLAEKVARESKALKEIHMIWEFKKNTAHENIRGIMANAEVVELIYQRIAQTLVTRKIGTFSLEVNSPYEVNATVTWTFDGAANKWTRTSDSISAGDYLSEDLSKVLSDNLVNPAELTIPRSVISMDYLINEHVAFDTLKTVTIDEPTTRYETRQGTIMELDLHALEAAKKLDTIILTIQSISSDDFDASALAKLHFKHLILKTDNTEVKVIGGLKEKGVRITVTGLDQ